MSPVKVIHTGKRVKGIRFHEEPLVLPLLRVIAVIDDPRVVEKILRN